MSIEKLKKEQPNATLHIKALISLFVYILN